MNSSWSSNAKRWCCERAALNMPANLENSSVATGLENISFDSSPKERSNYHTIALISHTSKVMLKILQAKLQQYVNCELPDVQLDSEKAEESEVKLTTSVGSSKKPESSRKTSTSALFFMSKPLLCGSQQTVENSSRDGNNKLPYLPPEKCICRSWSNS